MDAQERRGERSSLQRVLIVTNHRPVLAFANTGNGTPIRHDRPFSNQEPVVMSIMRIVTDKWPQLLVSLGILVILGGAAWIAIGSIAQGATPLAPILLLSLGMMPFLVGLEEMANRRKTARLQFNRR